MRCPGAITRDRLGTVRDNRRAGEWCVIVRAVNTVDAMTATVENVSFELLQKITARITAEVPGVNRVLCDLTSKPTGTIEWEEAGRMSGGHHSGPASAGANGRNMSANESFNTLLNDCIVQLSFNHTDIVCHYTASL